MTNHEPGAWNTLILREVQASAPAISASRPNIDRHTHSVESKRTMHMSYPTPRRQLIIFTVSSCLDLAYPRLIRNNVRYRFTMFGDGGTTSPWYLSPIAPSPSQPQQRPAFRGLPSSSIHAFTIYVLVLPAMEPVASTKNESELFEPQSPFFHAMQPRHRVRSIVLISYIAFGSLGSKSSVAKVLHARRCASSNICLRPR